MLLSIADMFQPDESLIELVGRTSIIYLALLVTLRAIGRREMGTLGLPDLLMVVLLADGVSNGLSGQYNSVTGALVVSATIIAWNYALDALAYHVPVVNRLMEPSPLKLVERGRMLPRNMRREFMSEEELRRHLRSQGVEDLRKVKLACMEPDGRLSVILFDDTDASTEARPPDDKRVPI